MAYPGDNHAVVVQLNPDRRIQAHIKDMGAFRFDRDVGL